MPKIVDHEARRAEVLDATWKVIREKGLEGATVREIARAAGVSNGVLAHYFSSKDDILIQAHKLAYDRVFERTDKLTADLDPVESLRQMLLEALPLDDERRTEAIIDVNYMGRALTNPALKEVRAESTRAAFDWWSTAFRRAQDEGRLVPGVEVDSLAHETLALIDGISIQAVLYPQVMTPELQARLVDTFLARIVA